jgi:hypothetical protein
VHSWFAQGVPAGLLVRSAGHRQFVYMRLARLLPGLATTLLSATSVLGQGSIGGVVTDAVSNRPLIGAIVTLRVPAGPRVTRTDETGAFVFARVPFGTHSLAVQRLGYDPVQRTVDAGSEPATVSIAMSRIAQLDTIRVRAAKQAIYGVVGTAAKLEPIRHATVQIIGTGFSRLRVDSTGHFFAEIRTPGVYMVRANAKGYSSGTVAVTVPLNDGVEVAMLLDTTSGADHVLAHAFADFQDRMIRVRPGTSVLVSRTELTRQGNPQMLFAIKSSPSFVKKALRFTDTACLFVDGRARPGVSLESVEPEEVEVVEVYGQGGDASGTLGRAWPGNAPCGYTGNARVHPGKDVVKWVSIWLKH